MKLQKGCQLYADRAEDSRVKHRSFSTRVVYLTSRAKKLTANLRVCGYLSVCPGGGVGLKVMNNFLMQTIAFLTYLYLN